ncbi:MAG: hypothetical protein ACREFR_04660, partial [Limisphaerales bacterium]
MRFTLLGLISLALAAASPQSNNSPDSRSPTTVSVPATNNVEEQQLENVMRDDDAAMDDVDSWIRENTAFAAHGAGESKHDLNQRIRARLDKVRRSYQDFLKR